MGRTGRTRAFTFIEILLAILIVGMVMTSLYGILVSTIRVKKIIEREVEDVKAGALAFDLIRQDIQSACALRDGTVLFKAEAGEGPTAFGGAGVVDFLASTRNRFPDDSVFGEVETKKDDTFEMRCDLCEIGYRVISDGDDRVLVRREDFYLDDDPEKGGVSMKLCRRVKAFEMIFYAGNEGESGEEPREEWDGEREEALPFAVKVRLVIDRGRTPEQEKEKVFEAVIPLLAGRRKVEEEEESLR
ncbi:MAG: PulJ/GspJ family protein [Planctomycetota bacterium]|jgi:prepilin-type N-terminal cleavage/methylation domain-containing protein